MFVHAQAFVVEADMILAALLFRDVGAINFKLFAVRIIEIDLCALGARTGHRADERDLPSNEMLDPFSRSSAEVSRARWGCDWFQSGWPNSCSKRSILKFSAMRMPN